MIRELQKLLGPLRLRLAALLGRGESHLSNSTGSRQLLQIELARGEVLDNVEHVEPYGFTSNPLAGAEVVAASFCGDRTHTVVLLAADGRYRKQGLQAGEVALYTDEGDYVLLSRGRIIKVVAGTKVQVTAPELEVIASTKVTLQTPLVECTQNLKVDGTLDVTGAATLHATANVTGMTTVGGLAATGAAGASTVSGNLTITGGNVTADGIALKTHVHSDPQGGTTGAPV